MCAVLCDNEYGGRNRNEPQRAFVDENKQIQNFLPNPSWQQQPLLPANHGQQNQKIHPHEPAQAKKKCQEPSLPPKCQKNRKSSRYMFFFFSPHYCDKLSIPFQFKKINLLCIENVFLSKTICFPVMLVHLQIIDINKKVFITVEMLYVVLVTLYNRYGFILIIDINKMGFD